MICPSLFLVTETEPPPTNWIESSVPDEASKSIFGLVLVPPVCSAFNEYVVFVSVPILLELTQFNSVPVDVKTCPEVPRSPSLSCKPP